MNVFHRFSLPLLLAVLFAAAPVASAQVLSPVRYLPGDDEVGPAPWHQDQPAIARGGDQFLAVWRDYRTGGTDIFPDEGSGDIFAARLDADGDVLDTTPIPISQEAGEQEKPAVAWNGTNWLVVWQTEAPVPFSRRAGLRAARVAPDGTVLDLEPIHVFTYVNSTGLAFALGSDGTNWLVVTRGTSAGENDLIGVRIGPDGTVLDPAGVVIRPGGSSLVSSLGLAFAVDTYLLTYDDNTLKGQRLSTDLQLLGSPFHITGFETVAGPVSNGVGFFVLSADTDFGQLYGHRITRTGTVLDPGGHLIVQNVPVGPWFPAAAWNGAAWVATFWSWNFSNQDRFWAARMAPDGTVLDPGGVLVFDNSATAQETALAEAPGGGVLVVFEDTRPSRDTFDRRSDITTFGLSPTLAVGPLTAAALGAPNQVGVDVAVRDGGALVVFRSVRSDVERILAHPLDADGQPMLAEPIELDAGPWLSDPHVAWNGALYLVTWSVGDVTGDVVARRVAADGTPVDPAPIVLMEGFDPVVAALGDDFLVVGIQQTTSPQIQKPLGVRVDGPTGAVLDPTPRDLGSNHTRAVSVTAVGGRWLLVYQRHPTHDNPSALIHGTLVEPSGAVAVSLFLDGGSRPAVASDGTTAFAVWHGDDVHGRAIQPDGMLLPTVVVSAATGRQSDAAIGWDGTQYVALYEDLRHATSRLDMRSDIYGTRVDADATVLDPSGFAVLGDPLSEILPAVDGRDGVALLMASDFREASPYSSYRVAYRVVGGVPTASEPAADLPGGYALSAVYPNPFNPSARFTLQLAEAETVTVAVFDALGRRVELLHDGPLAAGRAHDFTLNGAGLPSGLYVVRATGESFTVSRPAIVVR